jgi:DNA-binding NarL/FixJ family response regulator
MNIAIIEDQELFAKGLKSLLSENLKVKNIICFFTGQDALRSICSFKPDVVFLDLNLPDSTGIDILKELRSKNSKAIISILSMYKDDYVIALAKKLGANAYLSKDAEIDELSLITKIDIEKDKFYIGKDLLEKENNIDEDLSKRLKITDREKQILQYIVDGHNMQAISEKLLISLHTVKSHLKNIKKKLNVSTTPELISFIFRNKIIM